MEVGIREKLTCYEVQEIVRSGRNERNAYAMLLPPSAALQEIKLLYYLKSSTSQQPALDNMEKKIDAVLVLAKKHQLHLTQLELIQLLDLRASSEYKVHAIIPDVDERAINSTAFVASLIGILQ